MNIPTPSRRELFRLGISHDNRTLGQDAVGRTATKLTAVDHPPNHDGLDLDQLPPMYATELTLEQVGELFSDIRQLASDVMVMRRLSNGQNGAASTVSDMDQLRISIHALVDGRANRVQVRYRWDGKYWIDTLTRQSASFHLVRIRHPKAPGPA